MIHFTAIVACTPDGVIGNNNEIPWHIPEDLKRFKKFTMGKPLIMGRKTYMSLPGILPGRPHYVITRSQEWADEHYCPEKNVFTFTSPVDALDVVYKYCEENAVDQAFVCGGGEMYDLMLSMCSMLYLTIVHKTVHGDAHFPIQRIRKPWLPLSFSNSIEHDDVEYQLWYNSEIIQADEQQELLH